VRKNPQKHWEQDVDEEERKIDSEEEDIRSTDELMEVITPERLQPFQGDVANTDEIQEIAGKGKTLEKLEANQIRKELKVSRKFKKFYICKKKGRSMIIIQIIFVSIQTKRG